MRWTKIQAVMIMQFYCTILTPLNGMTLNFTFVPNFSRHSHVCNCLDSYILSPYGLGIMSLLLFSQHYSSVHAEKGQGCVCPIRFASSFCHLGRLTKAVCVYLSTVGLCLKFKYTVLNEPDLHV